MQEREIGGALKLETPLAAESRIIFMMGLARNYKNFTLLQEEKTAAIGVSAASGAATSGAAG